MSPDHHQKAKQQQTLPALDSLSLDLETFISTNPQYPPNLAVGAVVVRAPAGAPDGGGGDGGDGEPRALVLQRFIGDSRGGEWDIPGGGVDIIRPSSSNSIINDHPGEPTPGDPSIIAAMTRELREETGLRVLRNHGCIHYHEWSAPFGKWIRRLWEKGFLLEFPFSSFVGDKRRMGEEEERWWTTRIFRETWTGKFTFCVEVAVDGGEGQQQEPEITLSPNEHQAYRWITQQEAISWSERWGEKKLEKEGEFDFVSKEDLESIVVGIGRWKEMYGYSACRRDGRN